MNADRLSPTYLLADVLLDGKLREYVEAERKRGVSWRRIALNLRDLTDRRIDVTHVTVHSWFPDLDSPAESVA